MNLETFTFFRSMNGNVGRHAVAAMSLARAEAAARARGWTFTWEEDEFPYELGDAETRMPSEVLGCVLRDEHGRVLASLWAIRDPDRAYMRLVEAELASEADATERFACSARNEVCS